MENMEPLLPYRSAMLPALLPFALVLCLAYGLLLVVYRLYLHPLARIPGSKLTAATGWYETYCELFMQGGGQFSNQIGRWHKQYGPIVRINPFEVHINDADFHDVIYSTSPADKYHAFENRAGLPTAMFATTDDRLHRLRRSALGPYFSPRRVADFAPRLYSQAGKLCSHLERDFAGTGRIVHVEDMMACVFTDMNLDYNFDKNDDLVLDAHFRDPFTPGILDLQSFINWGTQFPMLASLMNAFPRSLVSRIAPLTKNIFDFEGEVEAMIDVTRARHSRGVKSRSQPVVFDELFASSLPPAELATHRLRDEAISLIGAGLETTKRAGSVTLFHLLDNPKVLARLQEELRIAIPDPAAPPTLATLQNLPYLGACVQEGLRLAYGAAGRSPRLFNKQLVFDKHTIPAGTPVSCETWQLHLNEGVFPDSLAYIPERWLDGSRSPSGRPLGRYMSSFGRGSRICIGMHLALAELHIVTALLLRRLDLELFETSRESVDMFKIILGPLPRPGTKGVRVMVK